MKIGIISDTHGSLRAWEMAYEKFFADADTILHAGDVLYHGPRNQAQDGYAPWQLAETLNACEKTLLFARGNCDADVDVDVLDLPLATPYLFTDLGGRRIIVTHGHFTASEAEKFALAKKCGASIFVSGHTHIGGIFVRDGVTFVNPGSPVLSKRRDGRQTVAVLADDCLRLYDLYTGEILQEQNL